MSALKCPMCQQPVKFQQPECGCGELLTQWWKMVGYGRAARQQGLKLAAAGDFLGACIAFLEDALANPMERASLVDAARALVRLDRVEEAMRLLKIAGESEPQAATVLQAIESLVKASPAAPAPEQAPAAPAAEPADAAPPGTAAPKAAPPTPFMALGALERSAKKGVFGKGAKRELSDGWKWVLALERFFTGSLDGLNETIDAWLQCDIDAGLVQYVEGLRRWQKRQEGPARDAFQASLVANAPILNPAIYYLHLHLRNGSLREGWQGLGKWLAGDERQRCKGQLERVVAEWQDATALENLKSLPAN